MLIPLHGFLKGDTLGLVVLVHDHETIRELASKLQRAASVRIAPTPSAEVYHKGRRLSLDATVAEAGLRPLERVDVVGKEA
jgi:hypothetical protein